MRMALETQSRLLKNEGGEERFQTYPRWMLPERKNQSHEQSVPQVAMNERSVEIDVLRLCQTLLVELEERER